MHQKLTSDSIQYTYVFKIEKRVHICSTSTVIWTNTDELPAATHNLYSKRGSICVDVTDYSLIVVHFVSTNTAALTFENEV